MSEWTKALNELRSAYPKDEVRSCFCIGPQNGQPVCPCQMREVYIKNGRYVRAEREVDLGPAPEQKP